MSTSTFFSLLSLQKPRLSAALTKPSISLPLQISSTHHLEALNQFKMGDDDVGPEEPLLTNRPHILDDDEAYLADDDDADTAAKKQLDPDTQEGVQQADAVNLVWTRSALVLTYCLILLNFCVHAMEQQTSVNLMPYVVSDFSAHSLIPAVGITSFVLSGVLKLPIAKLIDTWGRPQGLVITAGLSTLGLLLMALCRGVKTYAAAQIFHGVGGSGFSYILDIIIADTSSLRDRALAFAFAASPFLVTTFLGPPLAQWFLQYSSWRTSFAVFAVVVPVMAAPVFWVLQANTNKARRLGVLRDSGPQKSWRDNFCHYAVEFDGKHAIYSAFCFPNGIMTDFLRKLKAVGVILAGVGLTLFLLPFSIAGSAGSKWSSPPIIIMLLLGVILIASFVFYEHHYAPKPFVPFQLLLSRNVMGSFTLSASLFIAYFCWDGYYTSYLQVVHQLSVAQAGYVANIYTLGACLWGIAVGWLIRRTDRFKWLAQIAVPVQIFAGGLMAVFRQPHTPVIYVVLCQVLLAVSGGTLVVTQQMAVMAVAQHGQVASLIALLGLSSAVGSAVGSSVSGAIWTNTVYDELLLRLPEESKGLAWKIYENLELQLSYPVGDPVREAIMQAYAIAQRRMVLAGLGVLLIAIPSVAIWRDVRVSQFKQVKGRVL